MNPQGAARRVGHDTRDALHSGTSAHTCFACNSPLTPKRFQEVEAKRAELIEHVRATMILERDAEIDKIRVEAAAQVAKAKTDVAERETAIRKQAVAATTAALRERIAQAEQAKKVAEQQAKKLKADHEKLIQARIEAERQSTAKKVAEAVSAERVKHFENTVALTARVEDLKRRLEKRRPQDLGDEGEIAVFEALQQAFKEDEFTRIAKGVAGGDIEHRIVHNGTVVGSVLYECKDTKTFQNKWLARLTHDRIAARVDHAVLVTTAFKAGYQHLMFTEGVLTISPARVVEVAKWLRAQVIRTHSLRLSGEAKESKSQRLYEFMCSARVADHWDQMAQSITRMRDALRSERLGHERSWNDRADQIVIIEGIRDSFVQDLDAIFEATEANAVS